MRKMYQKTNNNLTRVTSNGYNRLYQKVSGVLKPVTELWQNTGGGVEEVHLSVGIELTTEELLMCDTKEKYISLLHTKIPGVNTDNLELDDCVFAYETGSGPAARYGSVKSDLSVTPTYLWKFYTNKKIKSYSVKYILNSAYVSKYMICGFYINGNDNFYINVIGDGINNDKKIWYAKPGSTTSLYMNVPSNRQISLEYNDLSSYNLSENSTVNFFCGASYVGSVSTVSGDSIYPVYLNYLKIEFEE